MKYKKILVSGCSFSVGSSSLDEAKQNPSTWSHYLINNYLTDINALMNVALSGGGNTAMVKNLVAAIETQPVVDPKDTLIIFNITGLQRIDMICPVDHYDVNKNNSWAQCFGFNWINLPHLSTINTVYKDIIQKNSGWNETILENSLELVLLFGYLENKGFDYKFMVMDKTIFERAPDFLKPYLNAALDFDGHKTMHEFCKANNLLDKDGFHPSDQGYRTISKYIFDDLMR